MALKAVLNLFLLPKNIKIVKLKTLKKLENIPGNDAAAGATLIITTTQSRSKYCNQIRVKTLMKKLFYTLKTELDDAGDEK